ncbi:MAG: DUF4097 family beta strand repeat protein [Candidatus Eremiobacteraeota bacterium]|nr:DUF4097 family beta strand repeat protein [Candidatus Eremiobacteraeota bacterium]
MLFVFAVSIVPADAQTVLDRSVARGDAKVLQIEAGGAAVTFVPSADASAIRVQVVQDAKMQLPVVDSAHAGNRLSVTIRPPSGPPLIPFVPSSSPTYTVTYPANMRLDARISSGDVALTKSTAAVEIFDQEGNINVDSPRASITAESARGEVVVTGALAPVDLAADDGDVTASLANGWSGNEIRMQSGTGAVHLSVPAGFRAKFDASSNQGSVHNPFAGSDVRAPFVWLYAIKGDVWVAQNKA